MKQFPLQIVTPDKTVLDGNATSLLIRTAAGDVEILAGHAELLSALGTGRARIRFADGSETLASVSGGFLSVSGGKVCVAATAAELSDKVDLARAEAARQRAEERIRNAKDKDEITLAKAKLARALSRISVKTAK